MNTRNRFLTLLAGLALVFGAKWARADYNPAAPYSVMGNNTGATIGSPQSQTQPVVQNISTTQEQVPGNMRPGYEAWYNGKYGGGYSSNYVVEHAYSTDGVAWSRDASGPILYPVASTWTSSGVTAPYTVVANNIIYVYAGGYNGTVYQIGVTVSTDGGRTYTQAASNPVITVGSGGTYDEKGAAFPVVMYDVTETNPSYMFKMWYRALAASGDQSIAYAYSSDGVTWTKFGKVLDVGTSGNFDDNLLESGGGVQKIAGTYYYFYGGNHNVAGRTQWTGGLATFTNPQGTYTKQGQILQALTSRTTTLTADCTIGTTTLTVASTANFQVGEYVLVGDSTTTYPMLSRISAIGSSTSLTLEKPARATYHVANSGGVRSVYSWSVEPRSVFWENGQWTMAVSIFQQFSDFGSASELVGWAYNTNALPTGTWTFDINRGVALPFDQTGIDIDSAENLCVRPVRFHPGSRVAEWANETYTQVQIPTRRLTPKAILAFTGSGAVTTSSGLGTMTGAGTQFTKELSVGDRVTVGSDTLTVATITSDSAATVTGTFTANNTNASFTVKPYQFAAQNSSGTNQFLIQDNGVTVGTSGAQIQTNVQTSGYTLLVTDLDVIFTGTTNQTWNMPSVPQAGETHRIKNGSTTAGVQLTLSSSANFFTNASASTLTLNPGDSADLVYANSTWLVQ